MSLVLDASVAVKLAIEESGSEAASAAAAGAGALAAPAFILVETANALRRKVALGELSPGEARQAFQDILTLPLSLVAEDGELAMAALELALELRHAVADCLYLALAIAEDAKFLTADHIFAGAVRRQGTYADRILLLGEAA